MIKLNILNMKNFLETVNACEGAVFMVDANSEKTDIHRQYDIQNKLMNEYRKRKNSLPVLLNVPDPRDYMSIVSYYAGDC